MAPVIAGTGGVILGGVLAIVSRLLDPPNPDMGTVGLVIMGVSGGLIGLGAKMLDESYSPSSFATDVANRYNDELLRQLLRDSGHQ